MTPEETNLLIAKMARVIEEGLQIDLNKKDCKIKLCNTCKRFKLTEEDEDFEYNDHCRYYRRDYYDHDEYSTCDGDHYEYNPRWDEHEEGDL